MFNRHHLSLCGVIVVLLMASAFAWATEEVTLRFAGRWTLSAHEDAYRAFERAIEKYEELNPHVDIEYIGEADHNAYLEKLLITSAVDGYPDIMHLYNPWVPDLIHSGVTLCKVPEDFRQHLDEQFFPATLALTTFDGRMLGVPTENQVTGLVYNKRIFAEKGIASPPDTWAELPQVAMRLAQWRDDGSLEQPGFVLEGWDWGTIFLAMVAAEGGSYLDENGRIVFHEVGLPVLERLVEWFNIQRFASLERWRFDQNEAAMGVMYPWCRFGLVGGFGPRLNDEVGVTLVPKGSHARVSYNYGWAFYVPESSPNLREAWRFLEFLALEQREREVTYLGEALGGIGSLPSNMADVDGEIFAANIDFFEGFISNLAFAISEPKLPEGQERMGILTAELNAAVNGSKSPLQAMNDAVAQIRSILDNYR